VRFTPRSVMGVVATAAVIGLGAAVTTVANAAAAPTLTLTSTAFADKADIPIRYTCQQDKKAGNDISPPLAWTTGTAKAKSYAVVLVDSTPKDKQHWAMWDIPATTTTLKEGLGLGFDVPDVAGAHQKAMESNNQSLQYFGPCPGGKNHKYVFTLYALKVAKLPGLTKKSTVLQAETAAKANALATATLSGYSAAKAK
jgi:Raf kinase inhibitor-like YbhB/YbcL family protein